MSKSGKISFAFIALMFVLVAWLEMATPLLTALFAYFALSKLYFSRQKWIAITLFMLLVFGIFYGFVFFLKQAFSTLPDIADTAIPTIVNYAKDYGIELPFTEVTGEQSDRRYTEQLKDLVKGKLADQLRYLGNFAKIATKEFVFLVIGLVVATSIFLNPRVDLNQHYRFKSNLYSVTAEQISARFRTFYRSFATVMGAQITISLINTALTAGFIIAIKLPYSAVVIGVTFLCGLLPIIGNLISNSVIVGIAFTISPKLAVAALVFLVLLHKLEYFLNSKIIGDRIKNPVWLTLLGLILGERLMGIPGMILAPVVLHYVKAETSQIEVEQPPTVFGPVDPAEPAAADIKVPNVN